MTNSRMTDAAHSEVVGRLKPTAVKMVECKCRECGALFLYKRTAVARGRGQFCTRACAAANGRAERTAQAKSPSQRYEKYVIRRGASECWGWSGFKFSGYGRIKARGNAAVGAHRVSYEAAYGPIPHGLTVLHQCDNRECTNPAHLRLGTNSDNNADRDAKGRTARGERCGGSKLTAEQVLAMREQRKRGASWKDLAVRYQASPAGVRSAVLGQTWSHLE